MRKVKFLYRYPSRLAFPTGAAPGAANLRRTDPMTDSELRTYFISHGGGPWPYMTAEFRRNFDVLEKSLLDMRAYLGGTPKGRSRWPAICSGDQSASS